MKVVQINTFGNRSTGKIACQFAKVFEKKGDECVVLYSRDKVSNDVKSVRFGSTLDVLMHGVLSRFFDSCGFHSKCVTRKMVKWLKNYKPDIAYIHTLHGYYINIPILFKYLKEANIKVVFVQHDCWNFTGHCAYFYKADCHKWENNCEHCPLKEEYPKSFFSRAKKNFLKKKSIFTSLDPKNVTVVSPSKWLDEQVRKSFLNIYKSEVIPNDFDKNIFKPTDGSFRKDHHLEDKRIILGVATTWDERKGLEDYLELSKIISDKYVIVLVGLNDKQIVKINNMHLSNVLALGRTKTQQELAHLYTTADVMYTASVQETFGMTIVEAASCGCKNIIGYNLSAISETLEQVHGVIIEYNDNRINNVYNAILQSEEH